MPDEFDCWVFDDDVEVSEVSEMYLDLEELEWELEFSNTCNECVDCSDSVLVLVLA